MSERSTLLQRVQICDFALNDAALYLDTHPQDPEALAFYAHHLNMRNGLAREFESRFGPITHAGYDGGERWTWVDGPWPWQSEEER